MSKRRRETGFPAVAEMEFEDLLPAMAERLGGQGLLEELCNGLRLLVDPELGVITLESLRRGAAALGLPAMGDGELREMIREGDLGGDGVLDETEFCVLMFRLSPELMEVSWVLAGRVFQQTHGARRKRRYSHER